MSSQSHITLKIFGGFIGLIILLFVGQVVYYLWQFRYGDLETIQNITRTYDGQFTQVSDSTAPTTFADYTSLIRAHNPIQGSSQAPITLIAFVDFGCPYSQENFPIFSYIRSQYTPAVRVVFKQLPLTQIHPDALPAALASSCAAEQNKFWEYHNTLFTTKNISAEGLTSAAQSIGLNMTEFASCVTSQKHLSDISEDIQDALAVGVRGTPTLLINGDVIEGVQTQETWDKLILSHLN